MATKQFMKLPKAAKRAAFAEMAKDAAGRISENTLNKLNKRYGDKSAYDLIKRDKYDIGGVPMAINKVVQKGTQREFFSPTYGGRKIAKVMFNRKWDAENTAKTFAAAIKNKKSK